MATGMIDKVFGWLIVLLVVLLAIREWVGAAWVTLPLIVVLLAAAALMVPSARRAGYIFLSVAILLTAGLMLDNPDWRTILWESLGNAAFFTGFFSALTILRNAAATSGAMTEAGTYLARQPPGRRYLALTFGAQVFALLLNYGAIQLLGTLALSSSTSEPDETIRKIRIRRMLLAIQRGFASSLPWSPLSFSIAISLAVFPGTTWGSIASAGLVTAAIVLGTGWAVDTVFKPRVATGLRPAPMAPAGRWTALLPLGLLLLVMLVPILTIEETLHIRVVGVVLVVIPVISTAWIWLQSPSTGALARRLHLFVNAEIATYRPEILLIVTAGYIGAVGAALVGPHMASAGIDLTAVPTWLLLLGVVWIMPVLGQLGANPILSASLVAPLLPAAETIGLTPTAMAVALICGWTLTGLTSPFTATTLLIARFADIPPIRVGWVWNGVYFLFALALLSAWTLIFAFVVT